MVDYNEQLNKNENIAYDLSLFEPKPKEKQVKNDNNVVEFPSERVNLNARRLENFIKACSVILIAGIVFTLFYCLLYCRVQITELHNEINNVESELNIAKSDHDVLEMELSSKTSLDSIEEKSKDLGMRQLESYQVEYFSLSDGDKAEVIDPSESENIFTKTKDFFDFLWD